MKDDSRRFCSAAAIYSERNAFVAAGDQEREANHEAAVRPISPGEADPLQSLHHPRHSKFPLASRLRAANPLQEHVAVTPRTPTVVILSGLLSPDLTYQRITGKL